MQTFSQQNTLDLPSDDLYLRQLIKPDLINGPWIAGGAVIQWIRGQSVSSHDVDIFFRNETQYRTLEKFFQEASVSAYEYPMGVADNTANESSLIFSSDNAKTFRYNHWKIQLIKTRFFDSVDDLLKQFDITACKVASDGQSWYTNHPHALQHINDYVLDMDVIRPETVIKRLFKYWTYNYQPTADLIERIQQTPNLEHNFSNTTDYDA